ncbi:MAG: hypothetical protein MJ252_26750 [archaeon]|nr:hypothetical protein [archaeon]
MSRLARELFMEHMRNLAYQGKKPTRNVYIRDMVTNYPYFRNLAGKNYEKLVEIIDLLDKSFYSVLTRPEAMNYVKDIRVQLKLERIYFNNTVHNSAETPRRPLNISIGDLYRNLNEREAHITIGHIPHINSADRIIKDNDEDLIKREKRRRREEEERKRKTKNYNKVTYADQYCDTDPTKKRRKIDLEKEKQKEKQGRITPNSRDRTKSPLYSSYISGKGQAGSLPLEDIESSPGRKKVVDIQELRKTYGQAGKRPKLPIKEKKEGKRPAEGNKKVIRKTMPGKGKMGPKRRTKTKLEEIKEIDEEEGPQSRSVSRNRK